MARFTLRRRFLVPDAAPFGAPVRGPDGVHVRRRPDHEWCVRHCGEGIQYTIREIPGIFQHNDIALLAPRQHLVIDSGAERHGHALARQLSKRGVAHWEYHVRGGEGCKSTRELERLCHGIQSRAWRRDLVIAVGGGAVSDLVRCVAAWLWKGLPLAIVPTTPTAYVDAGIGVKGGTARGPHGNPEDGPDRGRPLLGPLGAVVPRAAHHELSEPGRGGPDPIRHHLHAEASPAQSQGA